MVNPIHAKCRLNHYGTMKIKENRTKTYEMLKIKKKNPRNNQTPKLQLWNVLKRTEPGLRNVLAP